MERVIPGQVVIRENLANQFIINNNKLFYVHDAKYQYFDFFAHGA
jgi:hypothetical protein